MAGVTLEAPSFFIIIWEFLDQRYSTWRLTSRGTYIFIRQIELYLNHSIGNPISPACYRWLLQSFNNPKILDFPDSTLRKPHQSRICESDTFLILVTHSRIIHRYKEDIWLISHSSWFSRAATEKWLLVFFEHRVFCTNAISNDLHFQTTDSFVNLLSGAKWHNSSLLISWNKLFRECLWKYIFF